MSASFGREFSSAVVDEVAIVVGALIDAKPQVMPGAPLGGPQWHAEVVAEGSATGSCVLALDADGASAVTALMTGIEGQVPTEAIIDAVREFLSQAVSAVALKPVARGAKLKLGTLTLVDDLTPEGDWGVFAIMADKLAQPLTIITWNSIQAVAADEAPKAAPAKAPRAAAPASSSIPADVSAERIDVILDIDLPLVVRFGRTELPLKALTRIGPGSLIDLGRSPDDPVEILVSNRVVARGEVVIVAGNYGIRILDVVSPRDRVRSLES
jgi:flagellar motor switch protein FliN/FliY